MNNKSLEKQNFIVRRMCFDAGHRVMHERFKCFNYHGHRYEVEMEFNYGNPSSIGYTIDFKEIKRIACSFIDEYFDHGFIANPQDKEIIEACKKNGSKLYLMNLIDEHGFCNPTAENIAKELKFAIGILLNSNDLIITSLRLWETENCMVECQGLTNEEIAQLMASPLYKLAHEYKVRMGTIEYDERKTT